MGSWVFWSRSAAFTLGEMHTRSFYLAPFASAGRSRRCWRAGVGASGGGVRFAAAAILFLLLLRPIASRHRESAPSLRTGAAALIGRRRLVIERIANREGVGTVKIGGEVWTARSLRRGAR